MKKLTLLAAIALSIGLFQACSGNKGKGSSDSTTMVTDSTTVKKDSMMKDTSKMTAMADTTFAHKAAVGGMAEVAIAKLALTKTSSDKIKDFAHMMIKDHGKANDELMAIAKKKSMALPAGLDAEHQAKLDSLSKLSGKDFDMAYVTAMVGGHEKTLTLMQNEATSGTDADLKAFAAKTAVVVQKHLDAINKIQASMK